MHSKKTYTATMANIITLLPFIHVRNSAVRVVFMHDFLKKAQSLLTIKQCILRHCLTKLEPAI